MYLKNSRKLVITWILVEFTVKHKTGIDTYISRAFVTRQNESVITDVFI